jgi:hypothetical protein
VTVLLIRGVLHLVIPFICWFRVKTVLLCVDEFFRAEEVDAVGNKGPGYTKMVDVQTHLEAFLNMSLKSACFNDKPFFSDKNQSSCLGTTLHKWQVIKFSKLKDNGLNKFCCNNKNDCQYFI